MNRRDLASGLFWLAIGIFVFTQALGLGVGAFSAPGAGFMLFWSSIIFGMIASGTIRAFMAGFMIFIVDILVTGILIQSTADFFLVLFILFVTSIGVTSMMVSIASRFNEQQSYSSVAAFTNLILFLTSGAFYPTIGMPDWLKAITIINPEYYAVDGLRSVILRGQGLSVVGTDITALLVFSGLMMLLGIATFRRTLE